MNIQNTNTYVVKTFGVHKLSYIHLALYYRHDNNHRLQYNFIKILAQLWVPSQDKTHLEQSRHSSLVDYLAQEINGKNCPNNHYCIFHWLWVLVATIFSPTSVLWDRESRQFFDETSGDHKTKSYTFCIQCGNNN